MFGLPQDNVQYILHEGTNLISYPFELGQDIEDALPEDIQTNVQAIYGQYSAAININGNFMGSLSSFEAGKGYWIVSDEAIVFEFNAPNGTLMSMHNNVKEEVPEQFDSYQSVSRSYYFIEDLVLSSTDIAINDWIIAYNNEMVVGATQWIGEYTDMVVMGYDESDQNTAAFCNEGDIPTFMLYKHDTGEMIELITSSNAVYSNNSHSIITLGDIVFPEDVVLHHAYPNPFNPSTTINYDVPMGGMDINISVYDIRGRLVAELVNGFHEGSSDSYSIVWNAEMMSSGAYLVKLSSGSTVKTQKIMLIK